MSQYRYIGHAERDDLYKFSKKFKLPVNYTPGHLKPVLMTERLNFIREELSELEKAVESNNLAEQADALIDLVWVIKNMAMMMGLPWEHLWTEIYRTNMAKVPGGQTHRHRHDIVKPEGWTPPHVEKILTAYGYCKHKFVKPLTEELIEENCYDIE